MTHRHAYSLERAQHKQSLPTALVIDDTPLQPQGIESAMSYTKQLSKPARVMVVHHHSNTQAMLAAMFQKMGFWVTTARNNNEALAHMRRKHMDLVFSDLDIPLLDGYHLAHLIKNRHSSAKVVVMTGRCQAELVDLMTEGIVDGWLFKPFDLKALNDLLMDLGLRPPRQNLRIPNRGSHHNEHWHAN